MAIVACSSCGASNRVAPIERGAPRCATCKTMLPWVVDAGVTNFESETRASVPVIVDLWAEWCGPCKMISPVLQDFAQRHAGRVKVVKVDVDANPALGARFRAQSIPLLVLMREGREVDRIVGAPSPRKLERRLADLLDG